MTDPHIRERRGNKKSNSVNGNGREKFKREGNSGTESDL